MSHHITQFRRKLILARDGHACRRCGCAKASELEIDHILPRSKGGNNDPSNLQVLCRTCNNRKLDHLPGDAQENIVLRWAEEVFGPDACNERLTLSKMRRLLRRLSISNEFRLDRVGVEDA